MGNDEGRDIAQASLIRLLALIPIGTCAVMAFTLFRMQLNWPAAPLFLRILLFIGIIFWVTLGAFICMLFASELMRRGSFHRIRLSSETLAIVGELCLFLGMFSLLLLIIQNGVALLFAAALVSLSTFIAIGLLVFSLVCIKNDSLAGDQILVAEVMAFLDGSFSTLCTLVLAGLAFRPAID